LTASGATKTQVTEKRVGKIRCGNVATTDNAPELFVSPKVFLEFLRKSKEFFQNEGSRSDYIILKGRFFYFYFHDVPSPCMLPQLETTGVLRQSTTYHQYAEGVSFYFFLR